MNNPSQMRMTLMPEEIRARVAAAGVVGSGGAGFPTHVKLQAQAEIYLVNAAECEPLLQVDQQLVAQSAARLLRGLQYAMCATGASEGIVAIKRKYHAAIEALTPLLPTGIRLHILPDVYPAGDEVITIWLATGRRVPPASLPLSVGVVVNNVQTLLNVAAAVETQTAVTQRTLTINGAVAEPITLTLPLGTSLREALALAGGVTVANPAFINGGPMMGRAMVNLASPVTKGCSGITVMSGRDAQRREASQCIKCAKCVAACPMGLEPYYLYRQKNMAGNFENVGYAAPGKACIYNILIMEEKQTIVACGAGTTTKVVFPAENRLERTENVKAVDQYISRIDEMIERKEKMLEKL